MTDSPVKAALAWGVDMGIPEEGFPQSLFKNLVGWELVSYGAAPGTTGRGWALVLSRSLTVISADDDDHSVNGWLDVRLEPHGGLVMASQPGKAELATLKELISENRLGPGGNPLELAALLLPGYLW